MRGGRNSAWAKGFTRPARQDFFNPESNPWALQQIPPDLKEAAAIEGASRFTFFRRVTWPLLMPVTLFILVNAVINAFRTVDHIFVMTGGGPDNATNVLLFHIYEVGFKFWDQGYATALTVVLLAILAGLALVQFLTAGRRVHYQ